MNSERLEVLNVLVEKRAFYLNILKEMNAHKYTDVIVESALEDTILEIAEEISDCIWEEYEDFLSVSIYDEDFNEIYEASICDKWELVHHINSYDKYGVPLLYPVPIDFIKRILDELMLDFELINRPRKNEDNWDSTINIIWNKCMYKESE